MEYLLGLIILLIMAVPYSLMVFDKLTGKHSSCKYFGWHDGQGDTNSFDGCSVHGTCSKCGKEVMQDSQGNWF